VALLSHAARRSSLGGDDAQRADLSASLPWLCSAYKALQTLRTERLTRVKTEKRAARVLDQELIVFRRMLKLHRPACTADCARSTRCS
jgi:hypothetical protein